MSVFSKILSGVFGNKSDKDLKELWPKVEEINKIYSTLENLSDNELKSQFRKHKSNLLDLLEK